MIMVLWASTCFMGQMTGVNSTCEFHMQRRWYIVKSQYMYAHIETIIKATGEPNKDMIRCRQKAREMGARLKKIELEHLN